MMTRTPSKTGAMGSECPDESSADSAVVGGEWLEAADEGVAASVCAAGAWVEVSRQRSKKRTARSPRACLGARLAGM